MAATSTAVIVCSRNRAGFLRDVVDSILRGHVVPDEIVIVDQSDARHEMLSSLGRVGGCAVRYIFDAHRGVSGARNLGLTLAGSTLVVFTDDDVVVDRSWLGAMVTALVELGPTGVVTGKVLSAPEETAGGWAPALVAADEPATYTGRIGRDVLEAGNMAAYRDTLLSLGGFDRRLGPGTRFPAGEDNDMGLRLLAAGCQIRYEPRAVIYHRAWRGPEEYVPLRWRYGIGQGAYYAKHLSLRDRYMLRRLGHLLARHAKFALRRARKEPRAAAGHLAYIGGVLVGGVRWALGRRSTAPPR